MKPGIASAQADIGGSTQPPSESRFYMKCYYHYLLLCCSLYFELFYPISFLRVEQKLPGAAPDVSYPLSASRFNVKLDISVSVLNLCARLRTNSVRNCFLPVLLALIVCGVTSPGAGVPLYGKMLVKFEC